MCSYALGDLLEMAGYGLTQRAASSVQISGLCCDPYRVRRLCQKLPSRSLEAGVLPGLGSKGCHRICPVYMSRREQTS